MRLHTFQYMFQVPLEIYIGRVSAQEIVHHLSVQALCVGADLGAVGPLSGARRVRPRTRH